jgi:hypothetical protein
MEEKFVFNNIYSLPITVKAGTTITSSSKLYWPPAPWLTAIVVRAISIEINNNAWINNGPFITVVDNNNSNVLFNYPAYDLTNGVSLAGTVFAPFKLRQTNIKGVVSQNCYHIAPGTAGTTFSTDEILYYVNFYW